MATVTWITEKYNDSIETPMIIAIEIQQEDTEKKRNKKQVITIQGNALLGKLYEIASKYERMRLFKENKKEIIAASQPLN